MIIRENKFMISCAARTGSTMLVHLLRSNRRILCHGEVFTKKGIGAIAGRYRQKKNNDSNYQKALNQLAKNDINRFIYDILYDSQGRKVVGHKYKTDEFYNPDYRHISDIMLKDTDIKILDLKRRNLLDQYISHQIVLKQGGSTLLLKDQSKSNQFKQFSVNSQHCEKFFKDVIEREQKSEKDFENHRSITLFYEDLVVNANDIHAQIQEFLNLEPVPLEFATKKIISNNKSLVSNLEELETKLVASGFEARI